MAAAFVFLYFTGDIKTTVFCFFLLAEVIFWIGYAIGFNIRIKKVNGVLSDESRISFWLFILFLALYIMLTLIIYALLGIPIFKESRLDTFTDSGGLGLLGRVLPFFRVYCIFYIYYLLNRKPTLGIKLLAYFSLAIFLVTGILSGSRSSFVIFITVFWGYSYFYKENTSSFIRYYKYFGLFLAVTLFTFGFQSGDISLSNSFTLFSARMVLSGDNYMMALPNEVWRQVYTNGWFNDFFYGLLGPARILSANGIQPPIGYQLTWLIYPKLYGLSSGPLSSPSLLGFIYFGWYGLIFVICIGAFTGFMMNLIYYSLPKGVISSILKIYLTINMITFIFDPRLAMGYLFDSIVCFIILIMSIIFVYTISIRNLQKTNDY